MWTDGLRSGSAGRTGLGRGKGEGSGAEVGVGFPLDGQGYGVRPACVARAKGVWEEEGQGTVTGIEAASWYGVLTSPHPGAPQK